MLARLNDFPTYVLFLPYVHILRTLTRPRSCGFISSASRSAETGTIINSRGRPEVQTYTRRSRSKQYNAITNHTTHYQHHQTAARTMPRTTRRTRKAAAVPAVGGSNSNVGTISNGGGTSTPKKNPKKKTTQRKQQEPSSPKRTRSGMRYAQKSPAGTAGNTTAAGAGKTGTAKKTDGGNVPSAAAGKSNTKSNARSGKSKSAKSKSGRKKSPSSSDDSDSPSVSPAEARRVKRELRRDLYRYSSSGDGSPKSGSGGSPKSRSKSGGGGGSGAAGTAGCKKKKKGGGGAPTSKKSGGGTKKKGDGLIPVPELARMFDAPTDKKDLLSMDVLARMTGAPTDKKDLRPLDDVNKYVQHADDPDESNGWVVKEGAANDDGKMPPPGQPGKFLQNDGLYLEDEQGEGGTVDEKMTVGAAARDGEDAAGAEAWKQFGPYAPAWAHFDKFMEEKRKIRAELAEAREERGRKFDREVAEKRASILASLSSPVDENEGETEGTDETMTAGAATAATAGAKEETAEMPIIAKWKGDGSSSNLAADSDVIAKEHGSSFGGDVAPPVSTKSPGRTNACITVLSGSERSSLRHVGGKGIGNDGRRRHRRNGRQNLHRDCSKSCHLQQQQTQHKPQQAGTGGRYHFTLVTSPFH